MKDNLRIDFGSWIVVYEAGSGLTLAFGPDCDRSIVGWFRSEQEAVDAAKEWFGVEPRKIERWPSTYHLFPFP